MSFTSDLNAVVLAARAANPTLSATQSIGPFFTAHADGVPLKATVVDTTTAKLIWLVANP